MNKLFKDLLNYWGKFLSSTKSAYVLTDDPRKGWFGQDAMEAMPNFVQEFVCDPSAPHYGYTSWDDFFVRKYREGIRPVEAPDDDSVVANACESAPFKLAHNVKKRDWFWIKNQQYSLGKDNWQILLPYTTLLKGILTFSSHIINNTCKRVITST